MCSSITVHGHAILIKVVSEGHNKFFTLKLNKYIQDGTKMFNIWFSRSKFYLHPVTDHSNRCHLNRTMGKHWGKVNVSILGVIILVSRFLCGSEPSGLIIKVEMMYFIPAVVHGTEGRELSQSPGRTKFGILTKFIY